MGLNIFEDRNDIKWNNMYENSLWKLFWVIFIYWEVGYGIKI